MRKCAYLACNMSRDLNSYIEDSKKNVLINISADFVTYHSNCYAISVYKDDDYKYRYVVQDLINYSFFNNLFAKQSSQGVVATLELRPLRSSHEVLFH